MMIGDYFGVTEQSQSGGGGWSDVAQRRAEVTDGGGAVNGDILRLYPELYIY